MKSKFYLITLFLSLVLVDGIAQSVVRGPYIQLNTPNSIIIRWRTSSATDSKVWYGNSYLNLTSISSLGGNRTEHEVQITGLTPNTTYYYAIGNSGGQLAGADPDHFFKTSPPHGTSQPVSIWVLGDAGKISVEQRAVRDGFYSYNGGPSADLILLLGDNAYDDGTDEEYQGAYFENMYESTIINTPIWPSIGNHDVISADSDRETGPYYDIFNMPRNGEAGGVPSGTEAWYSFDYANIHFIVLNTEDVDQTASSPMLAWLEQDIAATNQEWIVAYFHKQPYYTVGEFRRNFVPVLEEGGVDLVMYGHRHIYRRSFLMNGHYDGEGSFDFNTMAIDQGDGRIDGDGAYEKPPGKTPNNGTIYLVSGSAGSASLINTNYPFVVHEYGRPNYGSTHVSVNGGQMDVRFVDTQGEVLDYFTISKGVGNRPTVNITSPADGTEYLAPQLITINAGASDPDGEVGKVEFFANGTSIGVDRFAPYSLNWTIPADGLYSLEAVATDNDGNISQSAPVTIQVGIFEVCTSVASSTDDAEQVTVGGGMKLTSSDLELGRDASEQIIGLRFQGLSIPKNAQIISAEIKFVVDKTTSLDPCEFSIQGIASSNPSTFSSTSYDLANRPRTMASATWAPNEWGTVGSIQTTSDIKSIIQELVNQDAYAAGNALGFLIEGTGKRTATAFNGNPANAPQLCVVYTINDTGFECAAAGADIGTPCDDGDPCTVDDVIQLDCSCAGTPTADSDNDGTCDQQDLCNGGLEPGTPCDDGNSNTYDDEIDENCNCIGISIPYEGAVTAMVDDESDDAEEEISNGSVSLTSSDLELGYEPQLVPIAQLVGVRFTNIGIPQGAHITNAYIQFTLDEVSTGTANLLILGEDADNAQIFTSDAYNISDRVRTSASASWNPGSWDDGEVDGPDQRTVNIANIVQEIVNRPGWQPRNSMAFLISGTGTRTAASYDGSGAAPVLHIEYDNTSDCPTPGTPCNDGDACTINDVFDADCNCIGTLLDEDNDGICDEYDICPLGDDLVDTDGDLTPDACDSCPNSATGDSDGDGVCDDVDVCEYGDDTLDADGDGMPDECDVCPDSATDDSDGDGICDNLDVCIEGDDNLDNDNDGVPNACDICPDWTGNVDSDGDGVCDNLDVCPNGDDTMDSDADGTPDDCDACPNSATGDSDGDGVCDDLDACPGGDDNFDEDNDGIPDACDPCQNDLIGQPCDDGDPFTINDQIDANCNCTGISTIPEILEVRIANGSDDVEEREVTGAMYFTSSDLELVNDGARGNQTIGLRFNSISIPKGSLVEKAYVQFTADEITLDAVALTIQGHAADNAPPFAAANFDVSTRLRTSAAVNWSPPVWNLTGEAGAGQRTVDISPIIQELVDRPGWTAGSSVVLIITGTGKRTATAYEGSSFDVNGTALNAPKLHIEYYEAGNCPSFGQPCDDGDPCTANDAYDEFCDCVGEFMDADADGVCDLDDVCPNGDDTADTDADGLPDGCDDCPNSATGDTDGDGICDDLDLCPGSDDTLDADGDGIPDACDVCAGGDDAIDTDGDGTPDLCDTCPNSATGDSDGDGVCDDVDICDNGDDKVDTDGDGTPDACDVCPNSDTGDSDGDGVCDDVDICAGGDDAVDSDGDGTPDFCDTCPNSATGDSDGDGVCDDVDICDGGDDTVDTDGDGTPDFCDTCPNSATGDSDGDGVCDDADLCDGGNDTLDADNDGVPDFCDVCPDADDTLDADSDGIPDACDSCPNSATGDTDGDGVCDDVDICPAGDDRLDTDNDGTPDACDSCPNSVSPDTDGDGICDDFDICIGGDDNVDSDSDGTPDFCDDCPNSATGDSDGDGVCDDLDICDGGDDATDTDNDGVPDFCDACAGNDDSADADNDGLPDACDSCPNSATGDSDGDGVCDDLDICPDGDDAADVDGDGTPDACDPCNDNLIGTSCDDGDPNTVDDILDGNCNCAGRPTEPNTLDIPLASGNDDAEENAASGVVDLTSSDLELIFDRSSGAQVVGIRFNNVALPRGGLVENAYIQFTADKTDSELVEMSITGQAIADAPAFTGVNSDLSGRSSTAAAVDWTPMDWPLAGERGAPQRTPNIGPIIQELISRGDWQSGNSIVLLIKGTGGRRAAISYEGGVGQGPSLHIAYFDSNCNLTGQSCDDGDPCTTGDVYDSFCNCAGTLQDSDNDGICDAEDVCAGGDDTLDADGDGTPDACDACPNSATGDSDGDGVCDDVDVCPGQDDLADADSDGTPDACDSCPNSATDDSDGDGICDDLDICLNGDDNVDSDSDGLPDACDPCPDSVMNDDADNDGVCDGIDICPGGDDNVDSDGDGTPDACDSCPNSATGDSDGDGVCDDVDACPGSDDTADADLDGVPDACDICGDGDDTVDTDGDGTPDACDSCPNSATGDSDGDGVCDDLDICPDGDDRLDSDSDGTPNACDSCDNNLIGTACDDGNPNTVNDVYDGNCNCAGTPTTPNVLDVIVATGNDDAEEAVATGVVDLGSSDLEIVDDRGIQAIGIRFNSVNLPQGAAIEHAYVQFTADKTKGGALTVLIEGQATDNAPAFSTTPYNVSNRARTTASVSWSPPDWNVLNERGQGQRTADIAPIIQELVSRPGWSPGNAIVIIISGDNAAVKRTATSYDGGAGLGRQPGLHVEYFGSNCNMTGQSCDDGNPCTTGDVYDALCNCAGVLADSDNDGVCDTDDVCPDGDDTVDTDNDGTPDACDSCPNSATGDTDGDGVCDDVDQCPGEDDAADADADGTPDACDTCPNSATDDSDGDGICDDQDICLNGDDTIDSDSDGLPDACDPCPDSPANDDADNDGVCDGIDICPGGDDKVDSDGDGTPDACDACPNSATGDSDGDGVCDDADLCPGFNDGADSDGDTIPDGCDDCDNRLTGTSCDDGDPNTTDDVYDANCNCAGTPPTTTQSLNVRVTAGNDDAEEHETSGDVSLNSSDLELANDGARGNQTIGIRFNDVFVPNGAPVTNAYIQFTADKISSTAAVLTIRGEAADNAAIFTTDLYNVSQRPTTTASATWAPPAWNLPGEAGPAQRTVDLSSIIEEIVSRPGWTAGNSIVIIITGVAKRTAVSYDGAATAGPVLHVEWLGDGSACPDAGTPCDDGDPATENDVEDGSCGCAGTPCPEAGMACDDGDPNTTLDTEDGNCNCVGIPCEPAGTVCDDGDPCTVNDVFDADCNCAGVYQDNDNDGYCVGDDPDDDNSCIPDNSMEGCDPCDVIADVDFESGSGIWNSGGSDAYLGTLFAQSGSTSMVIQDNSGVTGSIYTNDLDLSAYSTVTIEFSYYPFSMDNANEDFWLQISTDGGATYTQIEEWNLFDEFVNDSWHHDIVAISGITFTPNTRLRFMCDASANGDQIHIDDVRIMGCTNAGTSARIVDLGNAGDGAAAPFSGNTSVLGQAAEGLFGVELLVTARPNPFQNELKLFIESSQTELREARIQVMDINGKLIYQQEHVPLGEDYLLPQQDNWQSGVYFVRVQAGQGVRMLKLVKQ